MSDLRAQVAALRWYHTIDLGNGVVTPGLYDTPGECARVPLPASLEGRRCLDIGTADGFWAFEMERRGAAEVVALDIDDPDDYDWPGAPRRGRGRALPARPPEPPGGVRARAARRSDRA